MKMFRNWKLGAKTLVPSVVVAVACAVGLGVLVSRQQKQIAIDQARRTASAISKQVAAERKIYTGNVVQKLKKDGLAIVPSNLKEFQSVQGGIPLPASLVHAISETVNAQGLHKIDLLSLWNLNPNKAPRNTFEQEALQYLVNNPNEIREQVVGDGEGARYMQVVADVASVEACVTCHNNHPASAKRDFNVGDTMGGLVIDLPLGKELAAVKNTTVTLTIFALAAVMLVTAVVLLLQWLLVNKPVADSLTQLQQAAERISTGELDTPVQIDSGDEIGELGKAFDRMRLSLKAAMEQAES